MNTLSSTIVESLKSKGESLSVAESITGGALTSEIVSVPGASHILKGSIVAYSVEIKMRELSVPQELIDRAALEGDRETVRRGAVESALGVFARILSA